MANEERVVLVAELRDEATADLDRLNSKVKDTEKTIGNAGGETEKSTGRMARALSRFTSGGSKALQAFAGGSSVSMETFTGAVRGGVGRAGNALGGLFNRVRDSDTVFGRMARGGTRGLQDLAAGFKAPDAAASSFTGRLGGLGGVFGKVTRGATTGLQNLASGFQSPDAAASSFTGRMGTIGGVFGRLGRGAGSVLSGIGSGLSSAAGLAGRAASGIGSIVGSAASAGASIVSNIGSAIGDAITKAGKLTALIGGGIAAAVGGIAIQGGISRAVGIEEAEARLRGLEFTAGEIEGIMDDASAALHGTSFGLDEAASVAATFANAGVNAGEDMEGALSLVADAAFLGQTSFEEMGQVFGRVAAYGKLDGQTLNQVLDRNITSIDAMAEHFETTGDGLREMVSNGEISFEQFAEFMESSISGAAAQMSTTTLGALRDIRFGLGMVAAEVAGPFMEATRGIGNAISAPLYAVTPLVAPIFEVLTERATEWADTLAEKGQAAAERLEDLVEPVQEVADLMRDGTPMFEAFAEVFDIDTDSGALGFLSDAVSLASDLSPLSGILQGIGDSLGAVFGPVFEALKSVAPALGASFQSIGEAIVPLLITLAEGFGTLVTGIGPGLASMLNQIVASVASVMPVIVDVLDVLVDSLVDVLPSLMPPLVSLVSFIGFIASEIGAALGDTLALIIPVVADLAVTLLDALAPVLPVIAGAILSLVGAVAPLLPLLVDVAATVISSLAPILPTLANAFITVLDAVLPILPVIAGLAVTLVSALAPVLPTLVDAFVSLVDAVVPLLPPILELATALIGLLLPILNPLITLVGWLAEMLGGVLGWVIENVLVPVIDGLVSALDWLIGLFAETGDETEQQAGVMTGAFEWIGDTASWLWENILEPFLGWLSDAWTQLGEDWDWVYQNLIEPALTWFGETGTWLWEEVLDPFFSWVTDTWNQLGEDWDGVYGSLIEPVFTAFGDMATWLEDEILDPFLTWVSDQWTSMGETIDTIYHDYIEPVFNWFAEKATSLFDLLFWFIPLFNDDWEGMGDMISFVWNEVILPVLTWFGDKAVALYEDYLQPALQWISDKWTGLGTTWDHIYTEYISPVFGWFSTAMDSIVESVETAVDLIGTAWSAVANFFRDPINGVIEWVWNRGIVPVFNSVASIVGIDELTPVDPIPEFAKGGQYGGGPALMGEEGPELIQFSGGGAALVGQDGPELVNFRDSGWVSTASETADMMSNPGAMGALSGPEPVLPMGDGGYSPELEAIGRRFEQSIADTVDRYSDDDASLTDRLGMASRDLSAGVGWLAENADDPLIVEVVKDGVRWVRGKLADTAVKILDPAVEAGKGALSAMGSGRMVDLGVGLIDWGYDKSIEWLRGQDEEANAAMSMGGWDGVFEANPGGFNRPANGPITSPAGRRAYVGAHGNMHYGVDIGVPIGSPIRAAYSGVVKSAGGGGLDQIVVVNHGGFDTAYMHNSSILASPGTEVTGGDIIARSGTAGSGPHLHFEYHPGGYYNPSIPMVNALLRDEGGVIPDGLHLVNNQTGGDEYVFNQGQFRDVVDLLDMVTGTPLVPDTPEILVNMLVDETITISSPDDDTPPPPYFPGEGGYAPEPYYPGGGADGGDTVTVDRRVTVQQGAITINVEAGPDGQLSEEGREEIRELLEDIFEEHERRGY